MAEMTSPSWTGDEIAFARIELGREFLRTPQQEILAAVKTAATELEPGSGRVRLTLAARKILRRTRP